MMKITMIAMYCHTSTKYGAYFFQESFSLLMGQRYNFPVCGICAKRVQRTAVLRTAGFNH